MWDQQDGLAQEEKYPKLVQLLSEQFLICHQTLSHSWSKPEAWLHKNSTSHYSKEAFCFSLFCYTPLIRWEEEGRELVKVLHDLYLRSDWVSTWPFGPEVDGTRMATQSQNFPSPAWWHTSSWQTSDSLHACVKSQNRLLRKLYPLLLSLTIKRNEMEPLK